MFQQELEPEEIARDFPRVLGGSYLVFSFTDYFARRYQQKNTGQRKKTAVLFYCGNDRIFFISWLENILTVINKIIKHCQFVITHKSD